MEANRGKTGLTVNLLLIALLIIGTGASVYVLTRTSYEQILSELFDLQLPPDCEIIASEATRSFTGDGPRYYLIENKDNAALEDTDFGPKLFSSDPLTRDESNLILKVSQAFPEVKDFITGYNLSKRTVKGELHEALVLHNSGSNRYLIVASLL